jgi:hypothetical protein
MTDRDNTEQDESRAAALGDDLDLTDEQASSVQGGITPSDIHVTKPVDKPTP